MGKKGAKFSEEIGILADEMVDRLGSLGPITWKKMFGGAGIYLDGKMFAFIDPEARLHFKVDDSNRARYVDAASTKHDRMSYFSVPDDALASDKSLDEWAESSAQIAKSR
jgi:DNA transformation protein